MKAVINEGCIGCGQCASVCPEVFVMNDEEFAEVHGEVTPENRPQVDEAVDSCPVAVIEVVE